MLTMSVAVFFVGFLRSAAPHPLLADNTEVCLITKDPQREYKDLLATKNIKGITRVRAPSLNRRVGR